MRGPSAPQGTALSKVFETRVSLSLCLSLSLSVCFSLKVSNALDHKGQEESSFVAELQIKQTRRQGDCGCILLCNIFMPVHLFLGPGSAVVRGLILVCQLLSLEC